MQRTDSSNTSNVLINAELRNRQDGHLQHLHVPKLALCDVVKKPLAIPSIVSNEVENVT